MNRTNAMLEEIALAAKMFIIVFFAAQRHYKFMQEIGHRELIAHLCDLMRKEGGISFCRFMQESLFHPQWGYYASAQIGREGDFYTNVSVGRLFGSLMGQQFSEMWEALGKPEKFSIYEQGANDARFAADVLQFLRISHPKCFQACNYVIVEPMDDLRQRQMDFLKQTGFAQKIQWRAALHEIGNEELTGVFFTNELLDSFPVHRIVFAQGEWCESFVARHEAGEKFEFFLKPVENTDLKKIIRQYALPSVEGYTTEICLQTHDWMLQMARILNRGFVLTVDYGFLMDELYHPDRTSGTLRCYYQHQVSDQPLDRVGEQDITAHVNFSDLIERGIKLGLKPVGYTDQHHFLVGIVENSSFQNLDEKSLRALRTLMHPEMMGTIFKVLIQQKGLDYEFSLSGMKYVRSF